MREKKYLVKNEEKNEEKMFSGITPMSRYIRRKYNVHFNSYTFINFSPGQKIVLTNDKKEKITVENVCMRKMEK